MVRSVVLAHRKGNVRVVGSGSTQTLHVCDARLLLLLASALVGAAGVFNLTSHGVLEQLPYTPLETLGQVAAHVLAGLAYVYALLLFPMRARFLAGGRLRSSPST